MKYALGTFLIVISFLLVGQGNTTSQYMLNPLMLNPGYTGYYNTMSANAMFRFQSLGLEGAPTTQSFSIHSPLTKDYAAVGFQIINESISVFRQTSILASGAYKVKMGSLTISGGLQTGIRIKESSYNQLDTKQANDPVFTENIKTSSPNVGAGIYVHNNIFYAGLSVPELINNTNENEIQANRPILLMGGYLYELNENIKIKPGALFRITQGRIVEANINCSVVLKDVLQAGLSYRPNSTLTTLIQVYLTDQLQLGYTYDAYINNISSVAYGSHEIGIQYHFRFSRKHVLSPRYF